MGGVSSMKDQDRLTLVRTDQSTRCDDEKLLSSWEYPWKSWKLWFWAGFWTMHKQRLCGTQAKMGFTQATQDMHAVCVMWEGGGSLGTISKIQPHFFFLSATGLEETEKERKLCCYPVVLCSPSPSCLLLQDSKKWCRIRLGTRNGGGSAYEERSIGDFL